MYRLLLTILLCLRAATPAPQGKESDVTYVKIQPVVEDSPPAPTTTRESRIEKLPLTFPSDVSDRNDREVAETRPEKVQTSDKNSSSTASENESSPAKQNLAEQSDLTEKETDSENLDLSETNQSDTISDPDDNEANTTDDLSEVSPTDVAQPDSDTVLSETNQSDRRARTFDSLETTETAEDTTEYDLIDHTIVDPPRTRAPPKFIPKAKSSYISKPVFHSYSTNHLEITGKRKFRSRCSCQKIWNCPKLQITVPRCPDEYFLCCF